MPDPSFLDSFYNNLLSIDPNYSVSRSDFAAEMSDSSLVASMFEAVKSKSDFFTSNNIASAEELYSKINEVAENKTSEAYKDEQFSDLKKDEEIAEEVLKEEKAKNKEENKQRVLEAAKSVATIKGWDMSNEDDKSKFKTLAKDLMSGDRNLDELEKAVVEEDESILDNIIASFTPLGKVYNAYDFVENYFNTPEDKVDALAQENTTEAKAETYDNEIKIKQVIKEGKYNPYYKKLYEGQKVTKTGKDKSELSRYEYNLQLAKNLRIANDLGADIETTGSLWWKSDLPEDLNTVSSFVIEEVANKLDKFYETNPNGQKLKSAYIDNQAALVKANEEKSLTLDEINESYANQAATTASNAGYSKSLIEDVNLIREWKDTGKSETIKELATEIYEDKLSLWNKENPDKRVYNDQDLWELSIEEAGRTLKTPQNILEAYNRNKSEIIKLFGDNVLPVWDAETNSYIREGLNSEQLEKSREAKEKVLDLANQPEDFLINSMRNTSAKLLTVIKGLNVSDVKANASLFQALGDQFGEGTVDEDFALFQKAINSGSVDLSKLTPLPSGTMAAADYNDLLEKYRTTALAYTLNYDPLTAETTYELPVIGQLKTLQGIIDAVPETLDIAYLNDLEQAEYFSEVLLENTDVKLSKEDKETLSLRESGWYKTGQMIPGLTKMGVEIAATTVLTGGSGTGAVIARNATILTRGLLGTSKVTPYVAKWLSATVHESIGLMGSNAIGSSMTHSEAMPVWTFAAGSSFGRVFTQSILGKSSIRWRAYNTRMKTKTKAVWDKGTRKFSAGTRSEQRWVQALDIINKAPTSTVSFLGKRALTPAVSVGAIKLGEVSSGVVDVATTELTFKEFWKHTTDPHSFLELYGAMVFMGASRPRALKKGAHEALDAIKTDMETMTVGVEAQKMWNSMGATLGLRRLKGTTTSTNKNYTERHGESGEVRTEEGFLGDKHQWSDAEIDKAVKEKIDEIEKIPESQWDPSLEGASKADAIAKIQSMGKRLKLKKVVAETLVGNSEIYKLTSGEGTLDYEFQSILKNFSEENYNLKDGGFDVINEAVNATSETEVVEMLLNVSDVLPKAVVEEMVKGAIKMSNHLTNANFPVKNADGSRNELRKPIINVITKQKALSIEKEILVEQKKAGDNVDVRLEELESRTKDNEKEYNEIVSKQNKINKDNFEASKRKAEEEGNVVKIIDTSGKSEEDALIEINKELEKIGEEPLKEGENLSGLEYVDKESGKSIIMVNPKSQEAGGIGNTRVVFHERLHKVLNTRLSRIGIINRAKELEKEKNISPEKAKAEAEKERDDFVKDFINVLKGTGEYDTVLKELKNHPSYKSNKLTDEWFTIYGELINSGLRLDKGIEEFSELSGSFNEMLGGDIFADGRSIRLFIQAMASGKGLDKNPIIKDAVKKYEELNKKYGSEVVNKASKDAGPELQLLYEENKADWDSERRDKGANKFIDELIIGGHLDGLIKAKIPYEKPPGFSVEDFEMSVYQELIPHIRNFNKKFREGKVDVENDSIFAWINSYLTFKVGNVFKKGTAATKDQFERSIDAIGPEGQKFDIEDTREENTEIAKAKVTSREIIEKSGLGEANNVINSTLRKLDFKKAPDIDIELSKNQTISPFLRWFKKESGDKLMKPIMEAMGKKEFYTEYLNNNFDGIVEALPVGYLLKNFPFLMQKSVGGERIDVDGFKQFKPRWTNNWVNKKVDYQGSEKGMTSRPEYIRLNPEWKSELNKEKFVETMTSFPDSKNLSRDVAAKKKALAYQLGNEVALKKFTEESKLSNDINIEVDNLNSELVDLGLKMDNIPDTRASDRIGVMNRMDNIRDKISDLKFKETDLNMINSFAKESSKELGNVNKKLEQQINTQIHKSATLLKQSKEFQFDFLTLFGYEGVSLFGKVLRDKKGVKLADQEVLDVLRAVFGDFEWAKSGRAKGEWKEIGGEIPTNETMLAIAKEIAIGMKHLSHLPGAKGVKFYNEFFPKKLVKSLEVDVTKSEAVKETFSVLKKIVELFRDPFVRKKTIELTKDVATVIIADAGKVDKKLSEKERENIDYQQRMVDEIINIAEFNQHLTSAGSPERSGLFVTEQWGGKYKSSTKAFFDEVVKPAVEANGFRIESHEGRNGYTVYNSKGEVVKETNRNSNSANKSGIFVNPKFIGSDGLINTKHPGFIKVVERQHEDADKAWNLVNKMIDVATNLYESNLTNSNALLLYLKSTQTSMNGILRSAARFKGIYEPLKGEKHIVENQGSKLEFEHEVAAETMLNDLVAIYTNPKYRSKENPGELNAEGIDVIKELRESYVVNIIPDAMNRFLNRVGAQIERGEHGYFHPDFMGEESMRAVKDVLTGEVKGKEFAEAAEIAIGKKELRLKNSNELAESGVVNKSSTKKDPNVKLIKVARSLDKALDKARETDKPVKKIRVFDFDDTLAKTNSRVYYNRPNTTGKPSPRFKAVLMAGGPGSGKSSVIKSLGLKKQGYKEVNQDISLEWAKKLVGLSEAEGEYTAIERSKRAELGGLARKIAERKLDKFTSAGKGVVIDGTGASLKVMEAKKKALEDKGYEVSMVYVKTSKDISMERNEARKERSLPSFVVDKSWESVNKNRDAFVERFGGKFFEVDTDALKEGEIPKEFSERVNSSLNAVERGRLNAGEFATKGKELIDEGFVMDFNDFNIVKEGERGPLFDIAERIRDARGTDDVFVLTARSQVADVAIQAFLKSEGLDIPLKNIKGLGNSTGEAKAQWVVEKAAEGYNDFYFADDHGANVEAVREALKKLPVKSKVQQAKYKDETKFSLTTKRDLKWEVADDAYDEFDTLETKFKIKDSEYSISMDVVSDTHLVESGIADFATDGGFKGSGIDIQKLQEYVYKSNLRPEGAVTSFDAAFYFHNYKHENLEKMSSWKREMLGGYVKDASITETGNAVPLLSIVINGLKKKFNESKSNEILTFVSKNEGGRTSLYRFLARELSKEMGLEVFTADILDLTFVGRTNKREHSVVGTKFVLMKESLLKKSGALESVDAKFSLTAKRDLNWTEFKGAMGFATGQKTTFMVKGKEYEIALGKEKKEHIEEKILDIGYRNAIREAGYDIEAIESRISAKRKPNMIDANFFKVDYIAGLEPNKWYGPDGPDQSIGLKKHAQADGDGIVRTKDVDITGDGDAGEVLGIVMNGLIKKYKESPENVAMNFTSFEPSRTRLYNTIANLFAKELNLEVFNSEVSEVYGTQFFLLNKEILGERKKITELDAESEIKFSLTTSKKLKWKSRSDESDIATFKSEGKDYFIATEKDIFSNTAVFEFGTYDADLELNYELTNAGNSREIFGTVINGMLGYIKKNNIDTVRFNSEGYKRTRLYVSMAKVFAKQLGWNWKAEVFETKAGEDYDYNSTQGEFEMSEYELPIDRPGEIGNWDKSRAKFSLTTKRDLKWEKVPLLKQDGSPSDRIQDKASFNIKGKEYNIKSTRDGIGGKWEYANIVFDLGGDVGMTKTGDAAEVISIVSNALFDYVKKNPNIREYAWSADGGSRNRLYKRLTKFWAEELGMEYNWHVDVYQQARRMPPAPGRRPGTGGIKLVDEVYGQYKVSKDKLPESTDKTFTHTDTGVALASIHERAEAPSQHFHKALIQDVLDVVDVNRPQQIQRRAKFSKTNLDKRFNMIIEESKGVDHYKEFSEAKGKVIGADVRKQKFFLPPSAEDFLGLLYPTLGKGSQGEGQLRFYQESLLRPYARGVDNLATDRKVLMEDFKELKKTLKVPKDLRKVTKSGFSKEQAVRVWLWENTEQEIHGISKTDKAELLKIVENEPTLKLFAEQILNLTKGDGYSTPKEHWLTGTITTDLIDLLNTTKRAKYLAEWKENSDIIFSKPNLNKLESVFGPKYREAMEQMIHTMKTGRNRGSSSNRLSNMALDYINGSVGVIMFTNMRSALLQGISAANFVNWSFNNPYEAGKSYVNIPQFTKDFMTIVNSDYLVDRRNGLKLNIHENEIANAAKTSKNKANAILNLIIEKGYAPTKFMDSFAIALGGSSYYRNRIKDLMKKNPEMKKEIAEARAFEEMRDLSELTQQSSDPSKISQQQSSDLGRLVLQFVNTPMQYARLQKRAVQDLANGRGDAKQHISRIIYYGFVQNVMFNALQQAYFAIGFGDPDEDEVFNKKLDVVDGMLDSSLRGLGLGGVTMGVFKDIVYDIYKRSKRDRPNFKDVWKQLLGFSPAISSKVKKAINAGWAFDSKDRRAQMKEGFGIDNPAWEAGAGVISAVGNVPVDRVLKKIQNLRSILKEETEAWKDVAMFFGWPEWQLDIKQKPTAEEIEAEKKVKKEEEEKAVKSRIKKQINYLNDLSKKEQVHKLDSLGVSATEIKDLKLEKNRVDKLYELMGEDTPYAKAHASIPTEERSKQQRRLYKLDKVNQIDTLKSLGATDSVINTLKYEFDRVKKIEELYEKNK